MENSLTRSSVRGLADKPGFPPGLGFGKVLRPEFYRRSTLRVAPALLGKVLVVRDESGAVTAGRIVETEAYRGDDPASHSARGKTPRASVMFGEPGVAYVYFIYGMYEMLNFVTEPEGRAGAVLIRALEPCRGADRMRWRRPSVRNDVELASGPGKLCRALGIRMSDNGQGLAGPRLAVFDDGTSIEPARIRVTPRVGITAAKENLWRFYLDGNPCVSRAPQNKVGTFLARKVGGAFP